MSIFQITQLFAFAALTFATPVPQFSASGSTANDVVNGVCKPVTLIFARGTGETGNMGTVVGPPLASQLQQALGASNVAIQGVTYAADIAGAISGAVDPRDAAGSVTMANLVNQLATACPTSKVVLSGYSQGAEQVHGALMRLGANNKVAAAVTFGDPLRSQGFQNIAASRTMVNCAAGDAVCDGTFVITPAHLSYGTNGDIPKSVQFIQQQVA